MIRRRGVVATGGPGGPLFWRVLVHSAYDSSNRVIFAEVEFRDAAGGADLTSPSEADERAFATSDNGASFVPSKAFDDSTGTIWYSGSGQTFPQAIGWQFAEPVVINEISLRTGNSYYAKSITIQSSPDGVSWSEEWSVSSGLASTNTTTRVFTRP